MSIVKSEFALALNQVATERDISPQDVLQSIEGAVLAAYKKEYPHAIDEVIEVKINPQTGEAKLYKEEKDITPPGFGRIAAQTAKQVIIQKIREAEKKTVISHYNAQIGTLVRGRVIRFDGYNAYVDIGKTEALLPKEEQIKNESYSANANYIFLLKEIKEDKFNNPRVIISRSDPRLIIELFKREVPEMGNNNTVEIKNVAREPGERAKIAVFSAQTGVDPVGACVGQKGIRVQTVTEELGGREKIDIIQWNKDDTLFLMAALSPAKVIEVSLDSEAKKAKVVVDETQAPLAIGKGGVNVNLASRLTGYTIDIVQTPKKTETAQNSPKTPSVEIPTPKQVPTPEIPAS